MDDGPAPAPTCAGCAADRMDALETAEGGNLAGLAGEASLAERRKEEDACSPKGAKLWERVKRTYHLCDFGALPEYLRDNEFIHRGYRADWPVKQALFSIFRVHNETGNIWTHLIGFILFLGLTIYTAVKLPTVVDLPQLPHWSDLPHFRHLSNLPYLTHMELPCLASIQAALPHLQVPESLSACFQKAENKSAAEERERERCLFQTLSEDMMNVVRPLLESSKSSQKPTPRWPFFVFLSGAMVCLLVSSTCHLLGCHSKEFNSILWRFDYAGIAALISTSFYPPVYYGFLCDPVPCVTYLIAITVMGIGSVMVSILDEFQHPHYRSFRAALFFGMGASGVVPVAHKLFFYWRKPVVVVTSLYELLMGAFYGLGAVFYATRIPERWLPGKFDIAGHSHQIFHILVVAGAYTHYHAALLYLEWRDVEGCSGSA